MSKYKVEVQDENGNVYYPHSEADVIFFPDGENVEDKIKFLTNPEFDASGSVAEIKDKSTLLTSLISKMSLVKFMRNVKAGFKLALYAGEMVNDCVTNRPDLPLSAAQGKVLMDLYTKLYSDIGNQLIKRPDYTTAESISFPYTAPADGYVCGGIYSLAGAECEILINGYMVGWSYGVVSHVGSPFMLPVKSGDIISAIGHDQTRAFFVHTVK